MDISEFRKQYPEYGDLTDDALADSLYNAHYTDMSRDEFEAGFRPKSAELATPTTSSALVHYPGQVVKGAAETEAAALKATAVGLEPKTTPPILDEVSGAEMAKYGLQRLPAGSPIVATPMISADLRTPTTAGSRMQKPFDERVAESPLWKEAEALEQMAKEVPEDPTRGGYLSQYARGLGSMAGMAPGALAPSPTLGMAVAGMMANAGQSIEDIQKEGKRLEDQGGAIGLNALLGSSEVAPLEAAFRFVLAAGGKSALGRIVGTALVGGVSEGLQEGLQQLGSNLIAKQSYKPDQDIWEGVEDSVKVALGIGATFGAGAGATLPRAKGKVTVGAEDFAKPGQPQAATPAEIQQYMNSPTRSGAQFEAPPVPTAPENTGGREVRSGAELGEVVPPPQTGVRTTEAVPNPAPVYTPPSSEATLVAPKPTEPEVTVQPEVVPQARRLDPPTSPVQEAMHFTTRNRTAAEQEADFYTEKLGRRMHVWAVGDSFTLRLVPQDASTVLGQDPEYARWREELREEGLEETDPNALRRLRAQVSRNQKAAEAESQPQQPNLLREKFTQETEIRPSEMTAEQLREQVITPEGKTQREVDNDFAASLRAELAARKATKTAVVPAEGFNTKLSAGVTMARMRKANPDKKFHLEIGEDEKWYVREGEPPKKRISSSKAQERPATEVQPETAWESEEEAAAKARPAKRMAGMMLAQATADLNAQDAEIARDAREWFEDASTEFGSFNWAVELLDLPVDPVIMRERIREGHVDGEQIREAALLYSFGDPTMFRSLWKSKLLEAVRFNLRNLPKAIAPGDVDKTLRAMAASNDPRKSFRIEEWEDMQRISGMDEWVRSWGDQKIPRETLMEELEARGIRVEEVWRTYKDPDKLPEWIAFNTFMENAYEQYGNNSLRWSEEIQAERDKLGRAYRAALREVGNQQPQHEGYTLPGGSNYVELVLTSPQAQELSEDPTHFAEGQGLKNIGWIRGKEFTDAQGRRIFHIEEVQSNRHQEGREKGYQDEALIKRLEKVDSRIVEIERQQNVIKQEAASIAVNEGKNFTDVLRDHKQYQELKRERRNLLDFARNYQTELSHQTPDAPFRKSWPTLLLRRALKWAAQKGYDGVTWTTGEQQAERYSLTQVVDELEVQKPLLNDDGTKITLIGHKDGRYVFEKEIAKSELPSYVGAEIAQRLLDPTQPAILQLSQETELGGQGMKAFYGSMSGEGQFKSGILSSAMKDAAKPFKVREEIIRIGEYRATTDEERLFPGTDAAMRELAVTPNAREFSVQPGVIFSPEMKTHIENNPMYLYSFGPQIFSKLLSGENMPGGGGVRRLGSLYHQTLGIPYWLGRINSDFKKFYGVAAERREKVVGPLVEKYGRLSEAWKKLSKDEQENVKELLQQLDGKKLAATPSPEIEAFDANGVRNVRPVEKHLAEFRSWLESKGASKAVTDFMVERKAVFSEAFSDHYNRLAKRGDVDQSVLQDLLDNVGFIPNYVPHMWYGRSYVEGYGADGSVVARVPVPWGKEKAGKVLGMVPGMKGFRAGLEADPMWKKAGIEKWSEIKDASEDERFWLNSPVPIDVMDRLLDESAARVAADPELAPLATAFRKSLQKETAQILKTKGFGNFAKRRGILGFEQNDVMGVTFDYLNGMYSSLAKLEAAREYTRLMFETKPRASDYKVITEFIADDMSPSSQWERTTDKIRMLLYLRYLGGRLSSAAVNLTNIPVASVPALHIYSSASGRLHTAAAADITRQWAKEFPEFKRMTGIRGLESGNILSDPELRFMRDYSDSVFQAQLMNEFKSQRESQGKAYRLTELAGKPMELTEWYMRSTTGLAALRAVAEGRIVDAKMLEKNGWTRGEKVDLTNEENYQKAAEFASDLVSMVHGDYTSFNKPPMIRKSPALKTAYTFRFYSQNLLEMWNHYVRGNAGVRGQAAALIGMSMQGAMGGLKAMPLLGAIAAMYEWWEKEALETSVREAYPDKQAAMDAIFLGVPSLAGVYMGGSLEIGFPTSVKEAIGIPAAVVEDVMKGYEAWQSGNWRKAHEVMMPLVAMKSVLTAIRESTIGQRTLGGRPIASPGEVEPTTLDTGEAILQALGFRPTSKEKAWRLGEQMQEVMEYKKTAQARLMDRYQNAVVDEDYDKAVGVLDEIIAWNMTWASKGRPELMISKESLSAGIKARGLPRQVPKQMRGKGLELREAYGD